jgi:hypothetical protein
MSDLPIPFVVIVIICLGFLAYYLRRPSDVLAGAAVTAKESARVTVSFAKGLGVCLMVLVVLGIVLFLVKSVVVTLIAGGPVAGLLAYLILRDSRVI